LRTDDRRSDVREVRALPGTDDGGVRIGGRGEGAHEGKERANQAPGGAWKAPVLTGPRSAPNSIAGSSGIPKRDLGLGGEERAGTPAQEMSTGERVRICIVKRNSPEGGMIPS
jgi:hypothetical protein